MLLALFFYLRKTIFDQSYQVHPIFRIQTGRSEDDRAWTEKQTEILVSNMDTCSQLFKNYLALSRAMVARNCVHNMDSIIIWNP